MKTIRVLELFAETSTKKKELMKEYGITHWHKFVGNLKIDLYRGFNKLDDDHNEKDIIVDYIGIDRYSSQGKNIQFESSNDETTFNDIVEKLKDILPKDWKPDKVYIAVEYFDK